MSSRKTTWHIFVFALLWSHLTRVIFNLIPFTPQWVLYAIGGGILVILLTEFLVWIAGKDN